MSAEPARTAGDLARDLPLSIVGKKVLVPRQSPAQFLQALVHQGQYVDAIRLMAVALLPREAVWWACLCCQHTLGAGNPPSPLDEQALRVAVSWVLRPDEAHRAAAETIGVAAGPKSATGCAARSASFGGVAAAPDQPVAPTQPRVLASLAGASVLLAAIKGPSAELDLRYRQFIALGIDVDNHLCHWDPRLDAKLVPGKSQTGSSHATPGSSIRTTKR